MVLTGFEVAGAILGGVGLLATIINAIASTTSNLNRVWKDSAECKRDLYLRKGELENYMDRMVTWSEMWEERLEDFCDTQTISSIAEMKRGMEKVAQQVKNCLLLEGSNHIKKSDPQEWRKGLDKFCARTAIIDPSLVQRAAYGIWRSEHLDKCMDRLKRYMEVLEQRVVWEYSIACKGIRQYTALPQTENIQTHLAAFKRAESFDDAMRLIHSGIAGAGLPICGLLGVQLDAVHTRILDQGSFDNTDSYALSFLVRTGLKRHVFRTDTMISLMEARTQSAIVNLLAQCRLCSRQEEAQRDLVVLESSLLDRFNDLAARSKRDLYYARMAHQEKRARMALDLAIWTSIMWGLPQMGRLCSCSIVVASVASGEEHPAFLEDFALDSFDRSLCRCHRYLHRQWLLLGILLAEIATGRIFDVDQNADGSLSFLAEENHMEVMAETSQGNILLEVSDFTKSPGYTAAVRECLSSDVNPVENPSKIVCMRYITEKVVEPLRRYHKILDDRKERFPDVYTYIEKSWRGPTVFYGRRGLWIEGHTYTEKLWEQQPRRQQVMRGGSVRDHEESDPRD